MASNCKTLDSDTVHSEADPFAVPFVITMVITLMISTWMLFGPADWLFDLMELTPMSMSFKVFLLALAAAGFGVSYTSEKFIFPSLAKGIGKVKGKNGKKRKEYKVIREGMGVS